MARKGDRLLSTPPPTPAPPYPPGTTLTPHTSTHTHSYINSKLGPPQTSERARPSRHTVSPGPSVVSFAPCTPPCPLPAPPSRARPHFAPRNRTCRQTNRAADCAVDVSTAKQGSHEPGVVRSPSQNSCARRVCSACPPPGCRAAAVSASNSAREAAMSRNRATTTPTRSKRH